MLKLPCDYKGLFKDRMVIITGVGRSGTTAMGELIASFNPVCFAYEPIIIKLMIPKTSADRQLLRALLFEDYYFPVIRGRRIIRNVYEEDLLDNLPVAAERTYVLDFLQNNYHNGKSHIPLNDYLVDRTKDGVELSLFAAQGSRRAVSSSQTFVIKMPDYNMLFDNGMEVFPGVKYINMIRNGLNVVASTQKHRWYSDVDLEHFLMEWTEDMGVNVPWYLDEETKKHWAKWSPVTRSASIWRWCAEHGTVGDKYPGIDIRYEDLCKDPIKVIDFMKDWLDLEPTGITYEVAQAISEHELSEYDSILDQIEQPEKDKFVREMEKLGYL